MSGYVVIYATIGASEEDIAVEKAKAVGFVIDAHNVPEIVKKFILKIKRAIKPVSKIGLY